MTRYNLLDTNEITAALIAELLAIQDYQPPPEIARAQAQVIRRLAARFQIDSKDLLAEIRRQGQLTGGDYG